MCPSVLQEDIAERERAERERRQKLKQKTRDKERTAKERAAAEREASEREARIRQEAEAKQREEEAAVERWGCLSEAVGPVCGAVLWSSWKVTPAAKGEQLIRAGVSRTYAGRGCAPE